MGISDSGYVDSLVDLRNGTDHLAKDTPVTLVSVVADGKHMVPAKVRVVSRDRSHHRQVLEFVGDSVTIQVEAVGFPTHSTLEVVGLTAASGVDVQTLLWGPLPTTLDETIGETAGVVADSEFVMGVRPLNDKTVGGWPNEHLAYGFGPDLVWNPYGLQTGEKDEWLASNVAAKTTWGSVLRATTYDYSKVRVRQRTNGYKITLGPLPAAEGRIVGSKIALFGSAPDLALTVLSQIAKEHDQAYPTLDGQWQKVAQRTSQTHFGSTTSTRAPSLRPPSSPRRPGCGTSTRSAATGRGRRTGTTSSTATSADRTRRPPSWWPRRRRRASRSGCTPCPPSSTPTTRT